MASTPKSIKVNVEAKVPKILTRRKLEHWLDKQQAGSIGRSYASHGEEADTFVEWFMGIYEEASNEEP